MGVGSQPYVLAASTPGKDLVPIVQEAGWAPGPVWTGGKSRPHGDSIPNRPARSHSLYRLSYPAHVVGIVNKLRAAWSGARIPRGVRFFYFSKKKLRIVSGTHPAFF